MPTKVRKNQKDEMPFKPRELLSLQFTGLFLLITLVYLNLYLLKTEVSYIPYEDYMIYSKEVYSIAGFFLGLFFVFLAHLSPHIKMNLRRGLIMALLTSFLIMVFPLLELFLPFSFPSFLKEMNVSIILMFNYLFLYVGTVFLFSLVTIAGVYGVLMANKKGVYLSLLSFFFSLMTIGNLEYFEDDVVSVLFETTKFTLFSVLFLAYTEVALGVCHFNERYRELHRYDLKSKRLYEVKDSFQMRYGMSLPQYGENYAAGEMQGVVFIFLPFLALMLVLALSFTLFSVNFDFLFAWLMTEAYKNSVVAKTIFGKVLFVIFFFAIILVVRGLLPSRTVGKGKK